MLKDRVLKFLKKYKAVFLIIVFMPPFNMEVLHAHTPHDNIDVLELSPTYSKDKTAFIVISDHLRRSTDSGFNWKELVNGLDHTQLLSSIAISPSFHTDETLFVSSYGDGIYRSRNGGDSWVKINNGLDTLNINMLSCARDCFNGVVLASGKEGGLFKTRNSGQQWYRVIESIKITAIAFFPNCNSGRILVGDSTGNLYISIDGGETWKLYSHIADSGNITSIAIPPIASSDTILFVGTEKRGVLKSINGRASFVEINKGLPSRPNIRSLTISPKFEIDKIIFASEWHEGVFCSKDGGNNWEKLSNGLTWDVQANSKAYSSPHYRDLKISESFDKTQTIFVGGFDGLFRSADAGKSWIQMETLPLKMIKGLGVSPGNKGNSVVALTTYGGGAYKTHDQGDTWDIINRGLEKTRLADIVFSPDYYSDKLIFSAQHGYLLRFEDNKKYWEKIYLAKKKSWRTVVANILRSLKVPGRIYTRILTSPERQKVYPTVISISPNYKIDKTIFFGTRRHGIYKSLAGGKNNLPIWDAGNKTITSLAISPDFPSDATLFASVRSSGLYKTLNAGATWQPVNSGLEHIASWQHSPETHSITKKDHKLAISPAYKTDKTVFAGSSEGLFKTVNGGEFWKKLDPQQQEGNVHVIGLGISPNYLNDKMLIVSLKGKGLFKSNNGGISFSEIGSELNNNNHSLEYIQFSKSYIYDQTIYAASDEELFQSNDGGNTWRNIKRPVRYENHREMIKCEWEIVKGNNFSATRISQSNVANDKAVLNFQGTGVSWIGTTSQDQGIANVYIDGNHVAKIDQFSEKPQYMVDLYTISNMDYGPHSIAIEPTKSRHPKSMGSRTVIDAFDIIQ